MVMLYDADFSSDDDPDSPDILRFLFPSLGIELQKLPLLLIDGVWLV